MLIENISLATQSSAPYEQELDQEGEPEMAHNRQPEPSSDEQLLQERITQLELENRKLRVDNEELRKKNNHQETNPHGDFSVHKLRNDPKLFKFYTGLPDYETFKIIFDSFGSAVNNLIYVGSDTNANKLLHLPIQKEAQKKLVSRAEIFPSSC